MHPSTNETYHQDLHLLEESLAYTFKDRHYLQKALVHSSYAFENGGGADEHYETLEFLGDAVLDLAVGFQLFKRFPDLNEGTLTKLRAGLVNETRLAEIARSLDLGHYLLLGKGEDASHGREKASILACAFEAVIGAVFLDGGFDAATGSVEKLFAEYYGPVSVETLLDLDAKSRLQEMAQERHGITPVYVTERAEGPDHNKIFTVSVHLKEKLLAMGTGRSKKDAEQKAAALAIKNL